MKQQYDVVVIGGGTAGMVTASGFRPLDAQTVLTNSFPRQAPCPVNGLGISNQNFLRVAAAERTGSTERQLINDRDRPPRLATSRSHGRRG